ncbi:MAG: hypothetical protein NXH75_08540 [Halobacteriovoraceae bacterium]|nr:hypothetical protein [Halobacteriovoraceae bacterium]
MKLILITCFLCISSSYAAPFTLKCKAGKKMTLNITTGTNGTFSGELNFVKAPNGADRVALKPGQCAWPHRGLNRSERNKVVTRWGNYGTIKHTLYGSKNSTFSITYKRNNNDAKVMAENLTKIAKAIKDGGTFSIVAPFDSGSGLLFIEKVLY